MAEAVKDGKVTAATFANMVGVTPRDIQNQCKKNIIPAEKIDGSWWIPFPKGLQAYIKVYKDKAEGRGGENREELERKKLEKETELKSAKAEMAKLDLAEKADQMHSAEIVEEVLNDFVFYVRSSMLALPGRIANEMYNSLAVYFGDNKPSSSLISSLMSDEVNTVLKEFSNYKYDKNKMKQKRIEKEKGDSVFDEKDEDEEQFNLFVTCLMQVAKS